MRPVRAVRSVQNAAHRQCGSALAKDTAMNPTPQSFIRHPGPLGTMLLVADDAALTGLYFDAQKYFPAQQAGQWIERETPLLAQARRQIDDYFAGRLSVFTLPCAPAGSRYQQAVWQAIAAVPFGETISYGELARRAGGSDDEIAASGHGGRSGAHWSRARAAGSATGRNPIGIVIPCHRIVGADGSLTGYAGGLERKLSLLQLEGVLPRDTALPASRQTRVPAAAPASDTMALF